MNLKHVLQCVVASGMFLSSMAHSAVSLSFIEQDGFVNPSDVIPIWVRMSTDADIDFNGSDPDGDGTYGNLNPDDIPTEGYDYSSGQFLTFGQIDRAYTNVSFTCSGSFTSGGGSDCPPGDEYEFSFNTADHTFSFLELFTMGAGESQDFLFGNFTPIEGSAALGTYNFYSANFYFQFLGSGLDNTGNTVDLNGSLHIGATCSTGDDSCDFSRTVVPLPAAVWLFSSALLGLVGAAVLRRRAS